VVGSLQHRPVAHKQRFVPSALCNLGSFFREKQALPIGVGVAKKRDRANYTKDTGDFLHGAELIRL
jgi:hypothetical protein